MHSDEVPWARLHYFSIYPLVQTYSDSSWQVISGNVYSIALWCNRSFRHGAKEDENGHLCLAWAGFHLGRWLHCSCEYIVIGSFACVFLHVTFWWKFEVPVLITELHSGHYIVCYDVSRRWESISVDYNWSDCSSRDAFPGLQPCSLFRLRWTWRKRVHQPLWTRGQ